MGKPSDYPDIEPFLAPDVDDVEVDKVTNDGGTLLIVTASAGDSTDQFLFVETADGLIDVTDRAGESLGLSQLAGFQGAASSELHAKSVSAAEAEDGKFQTGGGPAGGALACVWSLRTILHQALGYWVTKSDGTETFGQELKTNFGRVFAEDEILDGGLIISPSRTLPGTKKRIVGHVGIVGGGRGDARLIYSNSSRKKVWCQNYSVGTWKARQVPRKLDVLFYPLPKF